MDWEIILLNNEGVLIDSFIITDKTEAEAEEIVENRIKQIKEEVEDWMIIPIKQF